MTINIGLVLCFSIVLCQSQSFDGYIELGYHSVAPIWMELNNSAAKGSVTGTYFYKKVGKEIPLKGSGKGDTLRIVESDAKNNTGIFLLARHNDSLVGSWKAPKSAQSRVVKLFKSNPEDKKFARLPKSRELKLKSGKTLDQEMQENRNGDKHKPDVSDIIFYRRNILSLEVGWETMGAYPGFHSFVHSFDLSNDKEIELDKEIDAAQLPRFNAFLSNKIQVELTDHRKTYSDSEWYDALAERIQNDHEGEGGDLGKYFDVTGVFTAGSSEFFFTEDGLCYRVENYLELPHVIQSMDFNSDILIPFSELKKFLRVGSVLRGIMP
jgi:hypothetical protein